MHSDNNAEKFGQILGYAPGNVPAYSSDYATADDKEYPKRSAFRHYLDGIYMGYKWQCVEFARRWLYLNYGYIFDDIPMAYEIFDLRSVRDIANNSRLPLYAFRNGSQRKPEVGCLLIWAEGGEFEDTGHVAIITDVHDDRVCVAEQNVRHKKWAERQHYARCLQAKTTENGEYWIQCSFSDGEILGWMLQTSDATHAEPNENLDPDLFQLVSRDVPKHQTQRAWLNEANLDESAYVEMMAGHKMACDPILDHRYYLLSLTAEKQLELATNELHHLFMQATEYVIDHPEVYAKFNLPNACYSKIKQSWYNRKNQLITSRFDFSITAQGTKVYEYNCDSATCYMEAGKIQGKWAKHHKVREGIDAGYNLVSELIKAWKKCQANQLVHILRDHDKEEAYHALFMQKIIEAAGIKTKMLIGLDELSWHTDGSIIDQDGDQVNWVWKTWAWETALDQIRDECGHIDNYEPLIKHNSKPRLVDVLLNKDVMVFEPLWTLIPSNKAILAVLWQLFPNHPFLLNTSFELNDDLRETGYVTKPIVGRCGANIQLFDSDEQLLEQTSGNFESNNQIYQELFPLPYVNDYYLQVCTFTAAGAYAGACLRADSKMIIGKNSDCMALRLADDGVFVG